MAGEVGNNVNYYQAWAFVFQIDGVNVGGFEEAGPLKQSMGMVEQHEGGARTAVNKATTKFKSEKLTLSRGSSENDEILDWWRSTKSGKQDKRNCTLIQQDGEGNQLAVYPITDAIMVDYEAGTWDAKKDTENIHEKVELEYIDFDKTTTG